MQRPQTATTATSKTNESFSIARQPELHISLKLSVNPRLTTLFPNDPHADINITYQGKQYKLQKAHLRLETNYFDPKPAEFEETQQFNQGVFEKVLHCLYGKEYLITKNSELYYAFQVCHSIGIQSLVKQLEQCILEEFESLNFCIVYQLGETFKNEEIRQACFEHLENNPDIFKKTLDLSKAKCTLIKTKQLFQQPNHIESQAPNSVLLLNEVCFKQIIKLHNSYKQVEHNNYVYISYEEIYELICAYVECRAPKANDIELYRDIVRAFVLELIDKTSLKSKDDLILTRPEDVYLGNSNVHQEPSIQQMNNTVVKNTRSFTKEESKPKQIVQQVQSVNTIQSIKLDRTVRGIQMLQAFDPVLSENFLTKIEVRELREENTNLVQEVQKLKIHLESSVEHGNTFNQQMGQMKSHFNQLDQRLDQKMSLLQQDILDLKAQLKAKHREVLQKDQTIMQLQEQIQQMLPNQTQSIVIPVQSNDSYDEDEDLNDRENESFRVEEIEESQSRLFDQYTINQSQVQNSQMKESQLEVTQLDQLKVTQFDMEQSCVTVQTTQSEYFQNELYQNPSKKIQQKDVDSEINVISESQLKSHQNNRSNVSVSLQVNQQNKFIFKNDSVTLENHNDLCFLQKFFDITIFQKIECQQVYIGSRDGYSCADFMRICSGLTGLLILMKSFDYDKNFGIYLNTELDENELKGQGFIFSVTHQFVVPINQVQFGGKNFIKVGQGDLVIGNDCCEESTCYCSYPKSLEVVKGMNYSHLTGAKVFQLEEMEAFQLTITQTMS